MFAFSCDNQPYDFKIDPGNRFLSKIPRGKIFPIFNKNSGSRNILCFVQNPDFPPVFNIFFRGVAQKLLENSVGVSKMVSKHFLCALLWGSLGWLKSRVIRFFPEVIAKKPKWTNCFRLTILQQCCGWNCNPLSVH